MANNGLPPGATRVSGSLPPAVDASTPDTSVSQTSASRLPPGATLVSGAVPPASAPTEPGFLGKVGAGLGEAAGDIYGAVKGMVPGGAAEAGAAKTVWNNLPPVELADSVKQTLPLIHAYEQARSGGAPISAALTAVNEAAKQHSSNISQITPIIDAFKANPTRETARALLDATAAATSLLVGGEAAAPEAEAAATAAKAVPVAEAAPATEGIFTRLTNPFRKLLTSPKAAGVAAAQEPAGAAIRTATGAAAETPILAGAETAADETLAKVGAAKDAAYNRIDEVVGFDWKDARNTLKDTQYAIKQPGADVPKLQSDIDNLTQKITEADVKLAKAKIDPKVADRLNTSWEANKQFKNDLVKSTASDGTVNVNTLLNRSKNARFNPRYGDRLAQAFGQGDSAAGKKIADAYVQGLEAAQKAGVQAVKSQKMKQWVAGLVGAAAVGTGATTGIKLLLEP